MGLLVHLSSTISHYKSHEFISIGYIYHNVKYPKAIVTCKFKGYGEELEALPYLQTLRKFPKEKLVEKVVLVRFDSAHFLRKKRDANAVFTVKYLLQSGARVVLATDWSAKTSPDVFDAQSVADLLSSVIDYNVVPVKCISDKMVSKREGFEKDDVLLLENLADFKGEVANCSKFSQVLSSGVDIFVNDYFSRSHKILASTCDVARFCYACLAGFHFEENLHHLDKLAEACTKPYVAMIGGGNLLDKAAALHTLASACDAFVFVGMMSFQIMHALRLPVPLNLVEHGACRAALDILQLAQDRNVQILYPKDFWFKSDHHLQKIELFPGPAIPDGWLPVDIGPESLDEINSILTKCKKVTWIGPVKFKTNCHTKGASKVAQMLHQLSQGDSNITVVGNMACESMVKESDCNFHFNMIENASVVWEFLKGRKLPGIMALDRAYPFEIDWKDAYSNPTQPLVVDIGSGICPNPDFNEPEHRWRMLQRSLVEAVADLLTSDVKVFLQSDIEVVSVRMKEQFMRHGKGKLTIVHEQRYAADTEG